MSDTLVIALLGFVGGLLVPLFAYIGLRKQTATEATTERTQIENEDDQAREERINAQVDAFITNQNQELVALRAGNASLSLRLDVFAEKLLRAQQDILVCQKDRFDLAMQVTAANAELSQTKQRLELANADIGRLQDRLGSADQSIAKANQNIADLSASNQELRGRILKFERSGTP